MHLLRPSMVNLREVYVVQACQKHPGMVLSNFLGPAGSIHNLSQGLLQSEPLNKQWIILSAVVTACKGSHST
jgi:hypothetical protein